MEASQKAFLCLYVVYVPHETHTKKESVYDKEDTPSSL